MNRRTVKRDSALLAKLEQRQAEALGLEGELEAADAAKPPAPLDLTADIDAQIRAAAQQIEHLFPAPSGRAATG